MAHPLNRTLIACSVSALALAIVTLYYYQLRKRRKLSTACAEIDASNSSAQVSSERIEEHCLDASCPQSSSLVDIINGESDSSSTVSSSEEISQEEEEACSEGSGNDQCVKSNQSTINLDNSGDIREDDFEAKSISNQSCSPLFTSELNEGFVPTDNMLLKGNENLSPTFSNSSNDLSEDMDLVNKAKHLSLSNDSTPTSDVMASSIDCENALKSIDSTNAEKATESTLSDEVDGSDIDTVGELQDKEIVKEEINDSNSESVLLKNKPDKCAVIDKDLIANSNENAENCQVNDSNADNSADANISLTDKPRSASPQKSQPAETGKPANITKKREIKPNYVKPGQTFAQALAAKNSNSKQTKGQSGKTVENVPLGIATGEANVSVGNSKEDADAYHGYPDSALTSSEGQYSPNSDFGECSDVHSQGSNDSGKGGSDILHGDQSSSPYHLVNASDDQVICYQFEMPHYLCGKLIGTSGYYINSVKQKTNTQIVVNSQYFNSDSKICSITGHKSNVMNALDQIRRRFPIRDYPNVSLRQINLISPVPTIPLSQACQLHLPADIVTDVILTCTINAGHFFLQQPTHPSYTQLNQLDQFMKAHYSEEKAPSMPHVHPGIICASPTAEGWYRALIKNVHESNSECDVVFVDYGGYAYNVPVSSLRQIRYDFMSLPFQASECYLSGVVPVDIQNGWSDEANRFFDELAQGQIIYAAINGYAENGTPFVNLFKVDGSTRIFINKELVEKGYGVWIDIPSPSSS